MERDLPPYADVPDQENDFWKAWDELTPVQQEFLIENWRIRQIDLDGGISYEEQGALVENSLQKYGINRVDLGKGSLGKAMRLGRPEQSRTTIEENKKRGSK